MSFLSILSLPLNVFQTIAAIFFLLLVGYGAKRLGILKQSDASVVNSIILYLTMPAFIFTSIYTKDLPKGVWGVMFVFIGCELIVLGLAYLVSMLLKLDRRTTGGLMLAATFGNTGFLGYPVTTAMWPVKPAADAAIVTSVILDNFAMAMWLYSLGVIVAATFASTTFSKGSLLTFLKTPLIPTTVITLLLRHAPVPEPFIIGMRYLAAGTIPLAMLSLGLSLSTSSMRGMATPFIACILLKVAALPLLVHIGLSFAGIDGIVHDAAVLEATMPSAVMTGVVAGKFGANGPFVSATVFLMTLFSLGTIPLVLMLLH